MTDSIRGSTDLPRLNVSASEDAETPAPLSVNPGSPMDALVGSDNARVAAEQLRGPEGAQAAANASDGALEKAESLVDSPMVRRALMDPSVARTEAYQSLVDGIQSTSLYRTYHRDVRRQLNEEIRSVLSDSETTGTVVTARTVDQPHLFKFTKKLYELVQETAHSAGMIGYEGGPSEVELKIHSSTSPNAYVYGFDGDTPRVFVYDAIVDVFFDNQKGDWVSDDAKKLLQSVIAHELWHIKDSPAEWRAWTGILLEASGLTKGHEDGALFSAAEKRAMMKAGKDFLAGRTGDSRQGGSGGAVHANTFVADPKGIQAAGRIAKSLGIEPEVATQTLLKMFGISQKDLATREGIERDENGDATKFGILQAIFQDYYQQTRAGEIAADRGAYLIQGTHEYTGLIDKMLGTMTNFNLFGDSAEEKHDLMATLFQRDDKGELTMLKNWVQEQRHQMSENANSFNVPDQLAKLDCVTHPPSLPRVILGAHYTDRFRNPDAFIHNLADLEATRDPVAKTLDAIRALHHGKHQDVTRFVDPRGFERADATARVSHEILYQSEIDNWDRAIAQALETFDSIVSDRALLGPEFDRVVETVEEFPGTSALVNLREVPMEKLTEHLIKRLEGALSRAEGPDAAGLEARLETAWDLHRYQLDRAENMFNQSGEAEEDRLDLLLRTIEEGRS